MISYLNNCLSSVHWFQNWIPEIMAMTRIFLLKDLNVVQSNTNDTSIICCLVKNSSILLPFQIHILKNYYCIPADLSCLIGRVYWFHFHCSIFSIHFTRRILFAWIFSGICNFGRNKCKTVSFSTIYKLFLSFCAKY
jgi:hypothetical protein